MTRRLSVLLFALAVIVGVGVVALPRAITTTSYGEGHITGAPASTPRGAGRPGLEACAGARHEVPQTSQTDSCQATGTVEPAPAPARTTAGTQPTNPIRFTSDKVFSVDDTLGNKQHSKYWIVVPKAYDRSHRTPTTLMVWLHGCQSDSSNEIYTPSPAVRDGTPQQFWISIAPGGREYVPGKTTGCWHTGQDEGLVMAAIRNVETHFNINRHRILIGGFSSGGNLAYRTIFDHSRMFAGILAEGTEPFKYSGRTQAELLREVKHTFHIVHVAHLQDDEYPIGEVRRELAVLKAAGFPLISVERPGPHSTPDSGDTGTGHDADVYLFPHLYDGWRSP